MGSEGSVSGEPLTARRLGLWVVFGSLTIYLATWLPCLGFYYFFQSEILAQGEDPAARSVLWTVPEEVVEEPLKSWRLIDLEGTRFRGPPGELSASGRDGEMVHCSVPGGSFRLQSFPPGFLISLLEEETFGSALPANRSDARVLEDVARESPENYRFNLSQAERERYAARLLTKMLLTETKKVRRSRLARRQDPSGAVLALEFESGDAKILVADDAGVLVILLEADTPLEWRAPANWLR